MNRLSSLLILCMFIPLRGSAQQSPSADPVAELRSELRELQDSLRDTQRELGDAKAEIRALHDEIGKLREAPSTRPSPTTSDQIVNLEEGQQVLESRVDQHEQTKVETASKFKLKIDGMVLFNSGANRGEVDSIDVPNVAQPHVSGKTAGSVFGTLRQSIIGLQVIGPQIGGAKTTAEIQADFFGGFPNELDATAMGLVRMRVAKAEFRWEEWALRFGQDTPFISPLSPTSLASLGIPSFGFSGNLWTWTPQIVGERRWKIGDGASARLEFGVLDPFDGESPTGFERNPEAGERSRRPAFAARQSWQHGTRAEIGAGTYVAQQDYGFGHTVTAWASALDWNLSLPARLSFSGEFFRGRALGGLWGGIGQSVTFSGSPSLVSTSVHGINTIGGWSQVKFAPTAKLEFNSGFGIDNPFASDLRQGSGTEYVAIFQNRTAMVNIIERFRSNLLVSLEYRHLRTAMLPRAQTAEHINLGVGVQF